MTCTRTDAHPLSDCANFEQLVPGQYAELEFQLGLPEAREHHRATVLITGVEARDGYDYVTWTNAAPGGRWDSRIGQCGGFRTRDVWAEQGTRVVAVLPLRAVPTGAGYRDEPVLGGGHDEYQHLRDSAAGK